MPNLGHMLVATIAHPVNPRDVVVAIVGGTLLALSLTRPRLRWLEQLTDQSERQRLWAETGITFFAFVMGGYAWVSLFVVLHKQLGPEVDAMLKGTAAFLIIYAALVHFEPFLTTCRHRGAPAALALYAGIAIPAFIVGVTIAFALLENRWIPSDPLLLFIAAAVAALAWIAYRLLPRLEGVLGIGGEG
jgi:hypothetical protein